MSRDHRGSRRASGATLPRHLYSVASMRRSDWVPPIVWMAAILALSTDAGSAEHTGSFVLPALRFIWPTATLPLLESIHAVVRKLAHVTEIGRASGREGG